MPRNHVELLKEAAAKVEEAKQIQATADREDRDVTEDDEKKIYALLEEGKTLRAEAQRRRELEAALTIAGDELDNPLPTRTDGDDPSPSGSPSIPAQARDREEEDRCGFRNLGEFAMSVYSATPGAPNFRVDERLPKIEAAVSGMSAGVGSDGGWTMPPAFSTRIWDELNRRPDNLLNLVDQFTVEGESLTLLANAETSRATGSRYGGIQGYWIAEAEQMTASKPKLRQMKLEPQELAVFAYVTDKLLRNSQIALEQYLTRAAADEIQFLVGDAIFEGDGAGKPLGIMNSGCLITVAKEASQPADTFNQENVANMWSRLHVNARSNAVWLVNQDVEPQLDLMVTNVKNVAGTENVGGFVAGLWNPDRGTLHGRPVRFIEYASTLGDTGDVVLADLRAYAAGVRGGMRSDMSIHLRFDFNETAFRFLFEVDGQSWLDQPITPFKGVNTLSTFVALADRA